MEFQITQSVGQITCNFDELKMELSEKMSVYDNVIVSKDAINVAKSDLANLRKVKIEIDNKRKEAKKIFNQPYDVFEKQVKELIALVDKPIDAINKQLQDYENERIKEKQEHLKKLYDENIGEYADFLPFEKVKRPQWDNKTCTDKDIIFDISGDKTKIIADLDVLKALNSEIYDKLIEKYKANGNNLASAIKMNSDYQSAKKVAEEKVVEQKKEEPPIVETVKEEPKKCYATYTVRAKDEAQAEQLRQLLDFNEFEYSVEY